MDYVLWIRSHFYKPIKTINEGTGQKRVLFTNDLHLRHMGPGYVAFFAKRPTGNSPFQQMVCQILIFEIVYEADQASFSLD